jgi:GxxExxY protein
MAYILTKREEELCRIIVDCAYKVHVALGPGLLEKIYEACFCHELSKRNVPSKRQLKLGINYDDLIFDEGLKLDVLVDDLIICEFKAVDNVNPIWQAQLLSHLKLTNLHVGFILNFNVAIMKSGIRRYCRE